MLDWLTGSSDLFGLPYQNWMLVIGGGLAAYFAALALLQKRRPVR